MPQVERAVWPLYWLAAGLLRPRACEPLQIDPVYLQPRAPRNDVAAAATAAVAIILHGLRGGLVRQEGAWCGKRAACWCGNGRIYEKPELRIMGSHGHTFSQIFNLDSNIQCCEKSFPDFTKICVVHSRNTCDFRSEQISWFIILLNSLHVHVLYTLQ